MAQDKKAQAKATPEQIRYADILFYGSWAGIFIMLITYFVYLSGILEPYIPLQQVAQYWSQPVDHYVHDGHVPLGWGWFKLLGKGDFLNFIGIALLAVMTIIGFITL
ncbi:MAG: DUF1634 domain-containing protein, partial [Bacteroidetes bacterium]